MLTLADINHLEVPDQLFSYAEAYRFASALLCRKVESNDTFYTWPHASVTLMLAAHAVELFLKGALLKRKIKISGTHNIQKLAEEYRKAFQDAAFAWEIPFANPLSETELIALMKEQWPDTDEAKLKESIAATPHPSIVYRYPVSKDGKEWRGLYGFTPTGFLPVLDQLELDFKRLRSELDKLAD